MTTVINPPSTPGSQRFRRDLRRAGVLPRACWSCGAPVESMCQRHPLSATCERCHVKLSASRA